MIQLAPENQWSAHVLHPAVDAQARDYIAHRYGVANPTECQVALGRRAILMHIVSTAFPAGCA